MTSDIQSILNLGTPVPPQPKTASKQRKVPAKAAKDDIDAVSSRGSAPAKVTLSRIVELGLHRYAPVLGTRRSEVVNAILIQWLDSHRGELEARLEAAGSG